MWSEIGDGGRELWARDEDNACEGFLGLSLVVPLCARTVEDCVPIDHVAAGLFDVGLGEGGDVEPPLLHDVDQHVSCARLEEAHDIPKAHVDLCIWRDFDIVLCCWFGRGCCVA